MRLLLVEDSDRLRKNLAKALSRLGHAVDEAADGEAGDAAVRVNRYDVIVLDLMLPGKSGLELLESWRKRRESVPILILTALDAVENRVRGLAMGADDYLVKPFALEELVARLEALVRRNLGAVDSKLQVGGFQIDLAARTVKRDGTEVVLTAREFSLLECLARHPGRVMSREEIESKLYGEAGSPVSNAVDVAIYALRRKLSPGDSPPIIHTRRGIGYVTAGSVMRSIRSGLANRLGGAALLLFLVGGGGLYFSLREALERQFDAALIAKADALIMASEIEDGDLEIDSDVETFAGFGTGVRGNYFVIADETENVKISSSSLVSNELPFPKLFNMAQEGFAKITLPEDVPGRAYWTTYRPAVDAEESGFNTAPTLKILVASSDATLRRTLRTTAWFVSIFGFIGVLATVVISKSGVRSGLKPLGLLSAEVEQIDVKRLSRRVPAEGMPQELQGIGSKINELLARLEDSFEREKRFSSNAAHELRTPLAELRTMTELGTRWPDEFTGDHGKEMLEVISELESLLGTLTLLSRAESEATPGKALLDLEEIVSEQIERIRPGIERRNLELVLDIEATEIETEPVLFRAILQNLLDNAIDYSPEQSPIRVKANRGILLVENQTQDLSPEDLPLLFARFWRKSSSRSEKGHTGLGLSVVRAGVEHLGGTCRAELIEGKLQVKIEWETKSSG